MARTRARDDFESALAFHRREWRVQRAGWIVIATLLALASLGVFGGGGVLSDTRLTTRGTTVEYARFARRSAHTTLTIVPDARDAPGEVAVGISREYLQAFRIETVTPEPAEVRAEPDRFTFVFAADSGASPIKFHLEPEQVGWQRARIFPAADPPIELEQFIYP